MLQIVWKYTKRYIQTPDIARKITKITYSIRRAVRLSRVVAQT